MKEQKKYTFKEAKKDTQKFLKGLKEKEQKKADRIKVFDQVFFQQEECKRQVRLWKEEGWLQGTGKRQRI